MSHIKDIMAEQELKEHRKKEGYRIKIEKEGTYNSNCPYCGYALSNDDVKKDKCIHCKNLFKWNTEFYE